MILEGKSIDEIARTIHIGAKTLRDKMLAETTEQIVPNIGEYRKIYQETKATKNQMISNIMHSLKGRWQWNYIPSKYIKKE